MIIPDYGYFRNESNWLKLIFTCTCFLSGMTRVGNYDVLCETIRILNAGMVMLSWQPIFINSQNDMMDPSCI